MECRKAEFSGFDLVGISAHHNILLNGLPLSPDGIEIEIAVHVIQTMYIFEIAVYHVIVFIKCVLRHNQTGGTQQFCAESTGMDHQNLIRTERTGFLPCENSVLGKR